MGILETKDSFRGNAIFPIRLDLWWYPFSVAYFRKPFKNLPNLLQPTFLCSSWKIAKIATCTHLNFEYDMQNLAAAHITLIIIATKNMLILLFKRSVHQAHNLCNLGIYQGLKHVTDSLNHIWQRSLKVKYQKYSLCVLQTAKTMTFSLQSYAHAYEIECSSPNKLRIKKDLS